MHSLLIAVKYIATSWAEKIYFLVQNRLVIAQKVIFKIYFLHHMILQPLELSDWYLDHLLYFMALNVQCLQLEIRTTIFNRTMH